MFDNQTNRIQIQTQTQTLTLLAILLTTTLLQITMISADDAETLIKFKQSFTNENILQSWNISTPPCINYTINWEGVMCERSTLVGLRLENMGLKGTIDMDSLAQIRRLKSISFINNSFDGPFPNINKISRLRSLYLSSNNFSGKISDDAFKGMNGLRKVFLGSNNFSGVIPKSLASLPFLVDVSIEDNRFTGSIPSFVSSTWRTVNFTNNLLSGEIPTGFSRMNASSFIGNPGLCGKPLAPCKPPAPPPEANAPAPADQGLVCGQPSTPPCIKHHTTPSYAKLIIIVVTLGLLFLVSLVFMLTRRKNKHNYQNSPRDIERLSNEKHKKQSNGSDPYQTTSRGLERPTSYKKSDNGKLIFLRNDRQKFEMQDLLKASAEVLGSGSFGSSYKAAISCGHPHSTFVVKRFRQMNNVGKEEFQDHMKRLGKLRHINLLPLVAFFYKRDEKLIISDFVDNGSLASHLHGRRSEEEAGLEWGIRLKIIKGVARGLAYLYRELPQLSIPHGHLKSSNVLLDENFEPLLSDYALSPLINREHAEQVMVAYKSPDFTETNETSKKTDVWCLGILILEILTGKFPANYLKPGKGGNEDLVSWVNSVVKEESSMSTSEMFDTEMKASRSSKGEMLKLLRIGVNCCEWNVEKRWSLREAVGKIEELKQDDNDDHHGENDQLEFSQHDNASFH